MCFLLCLDHGQFTCGTACNHTVAARREQPPCRFSLARSQNALFFFVFLGFLLRLCFQGLQKDGWFSAGLWSVPFPGHRVPVAMTASASIAPGICATVRLVKMQLQSSGEKAARTCSLHCMGLVLKLLAQIPVPQVFNPWPRAKERPITKSKRRNSVTACCSSASKNGTGLLQQG